MDLLNELARTDIAPALLAQVQALFAQQQAKLAEKDFKITALPHELAFYRRIRFGKASEALVGEQRLLFEETVDTDLAAIEEKLEGRVPAKRQRRLAGRQALPPELPRIEHRHEPESCQCGQCGTDLVKIGENVSEQLDVEPARFFVHRHIRPQYACRPCEAVTAAPIPPAVIDGGMAATGLLARVAASKYLDHLPLYRIEQIAARQGVPLARSTLAEWIGRIGVALRPLAELLRQQACLHADETPVRQLDPGSGRPATPTCGPIVPGRTTTDLPSSCSTVRPAAPALTRAPPAWVARPSDGGRFRGLRGPVRRRPHRTGLPGPRPAQILRCARRQRQPRRRGSAAPHRGALRDRATRHRTPSAATAGVAPALAHPKLCGWLRSPYRTGLIGERQLS